MTLPMLDFSEPPKNWTWEHARLLRFSPKLANLLRQRLIMIAFTAEAQHSIRAIDLLLQIPAEGIKTDFEVMTIGEIERLLADLKKQGGGLFDEGTE